MSNQTSDIVTEEDGDFFFCKSRKQPFLSAASRFLHLSRHVRCARNISLSGQTEEEAKKKKKDTESSKSSVLFSENFQDQESRSLYGGCERGAMVYFSHIHCGEPFHANMLSVGAENWCLLQNVARYRQKYQQSLFFYIYYYYYCYNNNNNNDNNNNNVISIVL